MDLDREEYLISQIVVKTDTFTEKSRDDVLDSDWLISDNLVALKVTATHQDIKFCNRTTT